MERTLLQQQKSLYPKVRAVEEIEVIEIKPKLSTWSNPHKRMLTKEEKDLDDLKETIKNLVETVEIGRAHV